MSTLNQTTFIRIINYIDINQQESHMPIYQPIYHSPKTTKPLHLFYRKIQILCWCCAWFSRLRRCAWCCEMPVAGRPEKCARPHISGFRHSTGQGVSRKRPRKIHLVFVTRLKLSISHFVFLFGAPEFWDTPATKPVSELVRPGCCHEMVR